MPNDNFLTTTTQVVDALGGNGVVTLLTERGKGVVSNWRRFATFPADTYVAMTIALANVGKSAPASLWRQVGTGTGFARKRRRRPRNRKRVVRITKDESREGARSSA